MKNNWFAHGQVNEKSKMNLFLFPYAGGTSSNYAKWKKYINTDISVYPVLYPLREKRMFDEMPGSIKEMVMEFVDSNIELFKRPYILFGHCTGALYAYETAKCLYEKLGTEPEYFIVSGALTPNRELWKCGVEQLSDERFIEMLCETGRLTKETAEIPGFKEYYLPIMRADYSLLSKHDYEATYIMKCPIISFCGKFDTQVLEHDIMEWANFTRNEHKNIIVNGEHFFLEDNEKNICSMINEFCLGRNEQK